MSVVDVQTSPRFAASAPQVLFADIYEGEHSFDRNYDLSADGRRFLMVKAAFAPAELVVTLNWRGAPPDRK